MESYVKKFRKYFWFFHWNPYLKTDSTNLLILFSGNDFLKKICWNFYVIFLCNVFNNNVCIALGKTQNAKYQKPKYQHWKIGLICFEKVTFKKMTNLFEKIRPWWNHLKFCIINSVYIQPIWISRNIRMAHHSWFVVRLFSTKNINIEKTWTGLNVGFCYISNYIFCKCWVHQ